MLIEMYDESQFRVLDVGLEWRGRTRLERLPEVKWHAAGFFTFPATEPNIEALRASFRPEEYKFDEEARLLYDYVVKTLELAAIKEKRRWQYIFNDVVPEVPFKYFTPPYRHQVVAHDALHGQEFFALFMEMGTGKTKVVIDEWMACLPNNGGRSYKVLVTCPKSVVRTWQKEVLKHTGAMPVDPGDKNHKFLLPDGQLIWMCRLGSQEWGMNELIEGIRSPAVLKVWIINYERLVTVMQGVKVIGLDMMVCDESTRIKHNGTRRTKTCLEVAHTAARRVILTGTPITNGLFDLFPQFQFLQPASLGYTTHYAFEQQFANVRRVKHWDKVTGYRNLDGLKRRVARHAFIVTKDQCLDLPPKSYETVTVEMGPKQRAMYDEMLEWFMATLTDETAASGGQVTARSFLAKLLRLSQITQGFAKTVEGDMVPISDGDGKLKELLDIIDDLPEDRKLLVWARFHYDIDAITAALDKRGVKHVELTGRQDDWARERSVELFNGDNQVQVLIGEPGTGGLGLTLLGHPNRPCHTVVYYSNDYSLEKRLQSEDRCHRIGQTHPVTYIDLVCENSIDQHIAAKLQAKKDLLEEVRNIASIRAILLGEEK